MKYYVWIQDPDMALRIRSKCFDNLKEAEEYVANFQPFHPLRAYYVIPYNISQIN